MTKLDDTVRRETAYIAVWVLILSAVLQAVFLIIGKWSWGVLFGNILSAVAAVANFLLMGITIQKAVDKEQKDAAAMMKFSQSARLFMQFAAATLGVIFFNPIAAIVPLFFPRIAIVFRPYIGKNSEPSEKTDNE